MSNNDMFPYKIYTFLHKPLRDLDRKEGDLFLERFLKGMQIIFEEIQDKIGELGTLNNPATIRADLLQYLKDHVGFTRELKNITDDLSENDLRRLISLAVALWKQKGTELGYANIIRLFVGKSARIFNWFDFRYIVGEKAFGEEQLGEDAWFISAIGIEHSEDTQNNVVLLLPFEGNAKDRSIYNQDVTVKTPFQYYNVLASGFPQNSEKYLALNGGIVEVKNSSKFDFSGDILIEGWFRSNVDETNKYVAHKMDASGKGFHITFNKNTNSVSFTISDGINTVTDTFTPAINLDGGLPFHFALVMDRAKDAARLYIGGEGGNKKALGSLLDITNTVKLYFGGQGVGINVIIGDFDSLRVSLNAAYDVDSASIVPPIQGFIEFQEEQLDEFKTDIRVVDEGDLNKTLILRILNLMRPMSERLNVIFIRFFDDFLDGIGQFDTVQGNINLRVITENNKQMELQPDTIAVTSVLGDTEFQDIVLQVKANETLPTGGIFGVIFFFQDIDNYYEFRIDTINRRTSLFKFVAGVESQISSWESEDIVPQTSYIYTVITDKSESTGDTTVKAYIDSNKQHEVIDSSFDKGKFGMKTDPTTVMQIDELEMFELPLDVQTIEPGFNL